MAKKKNARPMPSDALDFHNPGHAAQSRYVAALVNPFAAPPVPIPDSFLTANCAKIAKEVVVSDLKTARFRFYRSSESPTGNYAVTLETVNSAGIVTTQGSYTCSSGARVVAGGIHYENADSQLNISGMVTTTQDSGAFTPTTVSSSALGGMIYSGNTTESGVRKVTHTQRDTGEGNVRYVPLRRQAMDFEGDSREVLSIDFSSTFSGIIRYAVLVEVDGDNGFNEDLTSNNDFVTTTVMANHHAGQFADTPLPDVSSTSVPSKHTILHKAGNSLFTGLWKASSHFVSSAAGWAMKDPRGAFNMVKQLPYVGSLLSSPSIIASAETAAIRAAPSLLMLGL